MKKLLCLILISSLLVVQTSAIAETGYLNLKETLNNVAGEGFSTSIDDSLWLKNTVYVMFTPGDETTNLLLMGYNSKGKPEGTAWHVEQTTLLGALAAFCINWSLFSSGLDDGYSLTIAYFPADGSDPTLITTEEQASLVGTLFESIVDK